MRSAFFVVLVALLAFVPAIKLQAQGADTCFGLQAADCALLQGISGADMSKLSSFTMDYTITAKVTGTGTNDVDLNVQGTGPFSIDAAAMSGASSNPSAALSGLTMANTITASLTASGNSQKGTFEFRIVGGKLYFMGDMATQGKWMSVDLTKAIGQVMSNPSFSSAMSGSSNPAMAAATDPETLAALGKAINAPGVITAQRATDVTIDGQTVAALQFNLDLAKFLATPELKPVIQKMAASSGSGTQMTDQQMNQAMAMAQTFLKDTHISYTQYVGTTDKLPHGLSIDVTANLDATTAQMVTGSSSAAPISADFHFKVLLSKVGQAASVTAPTGAQEIDLSGMMGGSMGGSGSGPAPEATSAK